MKYYFYLALLCCIYTLTNYGQQFKVGQIYKITNNPNEGTLHTCFYTSDRSFFISQTEEPFITSNSLAKDIYFSQSAYFPSLFLVTNMPGHTIEIVKVRVHRLIKNSNCL